MADTSGRAILLAGTTVVIALLGMFATGISGRSRVRRPPDVDTDGCEHP